LQHQTTAIFFSQQTHAVAIRHVLFVVIFRAAFSRLLLSIEHTRLLFQSRAAARIKLVMELVGLEMDLETHGTVVTVFRLMVASLGLMALDASHQRLPTRSMLFLVRHHKQDQLRLLLPETTRG
jgi:hypothetical protein